MSKVKWGPLLLTFSFFCSTALAQTQENWITKFEASNYSESPDYEESMGYFQRIADNSEYAQMRSMGKSPQGRELYYVIVSKDKCFNYASAKKSGKPIVLVQNGIHAGEISGKDASMLLLREILITKKKAALIDNVILLIIPIFNVDGHERRSPFNRINQDGPKEMGWRVTSQNYNLNRDYVKADATEMKCFLNFFNEWLPDFCIDVHATDGADYQYVTNFTIEKHENVTPMHAEWVRQKFIPHLYKSVEGKGFLISPFVGFIDDDVKYGMRDWVPLPRFSNGYAAAQNRPGLLLEVHQMKPYRERVFSTLAVLESIIELVNENPSELIKLNNEADDYLIDFYATKKNPYPLTFKLTDEFETFLYKGIDFDLVKSELAGSEVKKYNGKKIEMVVPYYNKAIGATKITLPDYYLIPAEWSEIISLLQNHGIKIETLESKKQFSVERTKFGEVSFSNWPYEGRFLPRFTSEKFVDTIVVNKGDYLINTNQRGLGIIAHILEPESPDSYVRWGGMNIIFERKEYFEDYSMEPIARQMYESNPKLKSEFDERVANDEKFKNDPNARLNFFYERSAYCDQLHNVYPVVRIVQELHAEVE
ncbi:MAG: carboxypeptidase [Bacteroidetes bacterium]|nr:carboxypeptidase [Bacteroidota bacterium]